MVVLSHTLLISYGAGILRKEAIGQVQSEISNDSRTCPAVDQATNTLINVFIIAAERSALGEVFF